MTDKSADDEERAVSFVYWTLAEIRDGHTWGDLIMELGQIVTRDLEQTSDLRPSFWAGEVSDVVATYDDGWPRVLELMGRAMRESGGEVAS